MSPILIGSFMHNNFEKINNINCHIQARVTVINTGKWKLPILPKQQGNVINNTHYSVSSGISKSEALNIIYLLVLSDCWGG